MAMANYQDQNAWWNKSGDEPSQSSAPAQQPTEERGNSDQQMRSLVQQELVSQARSYETWANERNAKYRAATEKFNSTPELKPYFKVAEQYFTQLNQKSGQQMPVEQLYDLTVEHIQSLRSMGVKPPVAEQPRGGYASGGQNWDLPDGTPRAGNGGIKTEDPVQTEARKRAYLASRRADLDMRKDRSTPEDEIIAAAAARASQSMLNLQAN